MMNKKTAAAIAAILSAIDTEKEYTFDELDRIARKNDLTGQTFIKYTCTGYTKEIAEEYTLDEVLKTLNSCAGADCYDCSWNFVQRNGKIYDVQTVTVYKVNK